LNAAATAYIGLGSNLNDPAQQLDEALTNLAALPDTSVTAVSRIYLSKPLGPQDQPDYLNAVAKISTRLGPTQLLKALQHIELRQGRKREVRWGARTIDLDILLYDGLQLDTPDLVLPHRELCNRNFVLLPLNDIAPELILPDKRTLASLLANTPSEGIVPLSKGD